MQKISDSTSTANAAGEFTEGSPAGGVPATLLKADWFNSVQRELLGLLAAVDIDPDKTDDQQILKAVNKLVVKAALKVGSPSTQHPVIAASEAGKTYLHSAMEIREINADPTAERIEANAPAIGWHWGGLVGIRMWMAPDGTLMWGDSAFHSDLIGGASKAQAEAGDSTKGWMSPVRVFQAIRSAAAKATEALRGVLRVGTQAEVDAGEADDLAVTPKKLRAGFAYSFGTNGFIAFPTWCKGFIFQWGRITVTQAAVNATTHGNWNFPVVFPNACMTTFAFQHALGGSSGASLLERLCGGGEPVPSGATFLIADADSAGAYTLRCFAIGY